MRASSRTAAAVLVGFGVTFQSLASATRSLIIQPKVDTRGPAETWASNIFVTPVDPAGLIVQPAKDAVNGAEPQTEFFTQL
jgi:hypothetical protein